MIYYQVKYTVSYNYQKSAKGVNCPTGMSEGPKIWESGRVVIVLGKIFSKCDLPRNFIEANFNSRRNQGPLITDGRNSCKWTYHLNRS